MIQNTLLNTALLLGSNGLAIQEIGHDTFKRLSTPPESKTATPVTPVVATPQVDENVQYTDYEKFKKQMITRPPSPGPGSSRPPSPGLGKVQTATPITTKVATPKTSPEESHAHNIPVPVASNVGVPKDSTPSAVPNINQGIEFQDHSIKL